MTKRFSILTQLPCLKSKGIYVIICVIFFIGCGVKVDRDEIPIDELQPFSEDGIAEWDAAWWNEIEDPKLHALIDSALVRNLDLAATWERLQAAEAVVRREGGNLLPQVEFGAQSAINRPQPDFAGGENVQFGMTARYEIDLWGRIRQAVKAEERRALASYSDYQAAALSLSAEIGLVWYRLVAARQQLQLAESQIKTNEDIFRLIRARFGGGQVRAVDILRQEQLLESTRIQQLIAKANLRLLEHQLAILLGKQPQSPDLPEGIDFPEMPSLPQTGLPLELVRRRPDIQLAYNSLLAADYDYASAVRAKYPRISVRLSGQQRANDFQTLFQDWAYTLAGNIAAPLFNGGSLSAEADRAEAVRNELLYNYGQQVLFAFGEVEDALVNVNLQQDQLTILEKQLDLAEKTNGQLRLEFLNGITPYLDVLLALNQEQQLKRDYIQQQLERIEARINLYRALAGPIETEREKEELKSDS